MDLLTFIAIFVCLPFRKQKFVALLIKALWQFLLRHSLLLILSLALFISQQLLMAPSRFSFIPQEYLKFIIPQLPSVNSLSLEQGRLTCQWGL